MDIQRKREFLINCAYWLVIGSGVYLAFKYLLPITVPFLLGWIIAIGVVWVAKRLPGPQRLIRIVLTAMVYGLIGLLITLLAARCVSGLTAIVRWLQELYELKLQPFISYVYDWCIQTVGHFDPELTSALSMLADGLLSGVKSMVASLSGVAISVVSAIATGIPSLILSILAMIFSTVFLVGDYEHICGFVGSHLPEGLQTLFRNIRIYLTDTLFVVIRSYALIMLLTFTELSLLFLLFGIENAVLKAALIAVLDILPILGTGGILIPWAVISLVLGYTGLGIELFVIYGIVTVVRNYVEPKIVGTQLGLHPIITLVSMFIGLRLFGFWGLFGLPVGISFFWKQNQEKQAAQAQQT